MKPLLSFLAFFTFIGLQAQISCEDALPIQPGIHVVDTITGDSIALICSLNGPAGAGDNSEWYSITVPTDFDLYTFTVSSSLPQNDGTDSRVHIYSGTCDDLVCIGGDDDTGIGYTSFFQTELTGGTELFIAWDDRWNPNGFDFEVIIQEYIEPVFILNFTVQDTEPDGGRNLGLVDMNGDFLDDLVSVRSSTGEVWMHFQDGDSLNFQDLVNGPTVYGATWSLTAGDLDGNGFNDLMLGGGSGVTFLIANADGTAYTEISGPEYVFSQRGNMVDINNDGHLDAFMCHDVDPNVYYMNDGEGNLEYNQGGLGDTENGGNYGSIWVDYDNDGDTDLFIAKCRGGSSLAKYNQLHRNNGDGTFTDVSEELGLSDPVQTWSSAWGDFDNDGDFDFFIGASNFQDGPHKLMQNNGDGTFTDITEGSGFENQTTTSIENVCHDFDNDGFVDVFGLGGQLMLNNGDMTFTNINDNELQTGILDLPDGGAIGDINNDGFLDILRTDLYINGGNDNNYIKFNMLGTASNINGIGAMVHLYTENGTQMRQVRAGDGFRYMSSLNVHFGLGNVEMVDSVVVNWPSGISMTLVDLDVNTTHLIEEAESSLGLSANEVLELNIFPNPARDYLQVQGEKLGANAQYLIYDLSGRIVKEGNLLGERVSLSGLETGAYIFQLRSEGGVIDRKFIKE